MFKQSSVLQDGPLNASQRVHELICSVAEGTRFNRVRVAVAYVTLPGCRELDRLLRASSTDWEGAEKQWLISIDYGHTDPQAINYLKRLRNSEVRIHDGKNVIRRRLAPDASFHPKTFVFDRSGGRGPRKVGFVVGSANLTSGGLESNVEHVIGTILSGTISAQEKRLFDPVAKFEDWWDLAWMVADRASPSFIGRYRRIRRRSRPRVRDRGRVTPGRRLRASVAKLRAFARWESAKCFWIETGALYENLGRGKPGNQLDAKRGTRVFFGFPYEDVPRNTKLGSVAMKFSGKSVQRNRSIWFGNNSMDKIYLPVPSTYGPTRYDHSVIHFRKIGPRNFAVSIGTRAAVAGWRRRSRQQGTLERLGRKRHFGFYS